MPAECEADDPAAGDEAGRRATVLAMAGGLGLHPDASEVEWMAAAYPAIRAMVDRLYSMPGVRYEEPVATFDPRTPSL